MEKALEVLAEQLGVAVTEVFGHMVAYQYLQPWKEMIMFLVFAVVTGSLVPAIRYTRTKERILKDEGNLDYMDWQMWRVLSTVLFVIAALVSLIILGMAGSHFIDLINPEAAAMKEILGMVN